MTHEARVRIAPEIFENYPGYRAHIVYATGVGNGSSDEYSRYLLNKAADRARVYFAHLPILNHPHIDAWRRAYSKGGSKPSKYPCSAEALLRRALKGDLPAVNLLVDLYNAISIENVLPIGGEDLDEVVGQALLQIANGGELFEAREHGRLTIAKASEGEPIWVDSRGVTCRRWNWRQCARTEITTQTSNAYFVLDALTPFGEEELDAGAAHLVTGLRRLSPNCEIEVMKIEPRVN
jgi:DNA/RNA-binding domain of Phe-tRNA-synthetase-like protein